MMVFARRVRRRPLPRRNHMKRQLAATTIALLLATYDRSALPLRS